MADASLSPADAQCASEPILRRQSGGIWPRREIVLFGIALLLATILLGGLAVHAFGEKPDTNSYALLADSFLHGQLSGTRCFDRDCASYGGRVFVIFPPLPALVAMPFVALSGVDFRWFIALGTFASGIALIVWWRIFGGLAVQRKTAAWLMMALTFGTPLYYVTYRSDSVWFLAQSLAFLLVTTAIYQALRGGSLWLAGAAIGAAFLCRQMSVLYLPFLFALALPPGEPLIAFRARHLERALALALPVLFAVGLYLVYNQVRFGNPLDTGYAYIAPKDPGDEDWINFRIHDIGLFSPRYVPFNLLYLLVEGFHFAFGGRYMLTPLGMDHAGTSILAASPFVLLAVFAPLSRAVVVGFGTIFVMALPLLFYHSNGFWQLNVQRFVLDWLPALVIILAYTIGDRLRAPFAILVTYAIALNVVTMILQHVAPVFGT
jgi:4-amino-4-deoxy-L-arabinose transferase-like glycosyltransferase